MGSAGIAPVVNTIGELDEKVWDQIINVNLKGMFLFCKFVAPVMIKQRNGRIIMISSIFGMRSPAFRGAYGASKHGLTGLMQTLSKELGPHNILVNLICPGPADTSMVRDIWSKDAKKMGITFDEYYKRKTENIPLGRLCYPIEVSDLVVFLSSDMSTYINGTKIEISGGATY